MLSSSCHRISDSIRVFSVAKCFFERSKQRVTDTFYQMKEIQHTMEIQRGAVLLVSSKAMKRVDNIYIYIYIYIYIMYKWFFDE